MSAIQPFSNDVADAEIEKLKHKLSLAQFPDELEGAEWDYGAPLSDVRRLTQYWLSDFNWREQEERLNRLPQYTTDIQVDGFDPLKVHFVYQKSDVDGAIPLLFIHGCTVFSIPLPIKPG